MKWWVRWWLTQFPRLAFSRWVQHCKHPVRYDGVGNCLTCGAPWFVDTKVHDWLIWLKMRVTYCNKHGHLDKGLGYCVNCAAPWRKPA